MVGFGVIAMFNVLIYHIKHLQRSPIYAKQSFRQTILHKNRGIYFELKRVAIMSTKSDPRELNP